MNKAKLALLSKGGALAFAPITLCLSILPESCFLYFKFSNDWSDVAVSILGRIVLCILIFATTIAAYSLYRNKRTKVRIQECDYSIQIEYGDLFEIAGGKKVISFDECFTTRIGDRPSDIQRESICGQYLQRDPIDDARMQELIQKANVKPEIERSKYGNQLRYKPGTIVPNGSYLLMSFAKLSSNGRGELTYEEYLDCLNRLWEQLDLYHGLDEVYMPVLGSKIVRFDKPLTQQQLVDIMVSSYRLSSRKMKQNYTLHIVCKKSRGFSLNHVFGVS